MRALPLIFAPPEILDAPLTRALPETSEWPENTAQSVKSFIGQQGEETEAGPETSAFPVMLAKLFIYA